MITTAGKGEKAQRKPAEAPARPTAQPAAVNPVWRSLATGTPQAQAGAAADPSGQSDLPQPPDVLASEPGRPLDGVNRAYFQMRFGRDLGAVRVHTGDRAEESAEALQADAYTVGNHIVFGQGRYAPATAPGRHLLAHELTHVVQQRAAGQSAPALRGRLPVSRPDDPAEREAEEVADAVTGGGGHHLHALPMEVSSPAVQRAPAPAKIPDTPPGDMEGTEGDVTWHIWPSQGLMSLTLAGEPWVTVRWTPSGSATPSFAISQQSSPYAYGVQVEAPFDLRVTVSRATEAAYAARLLGETGFMHSYRSRGHKVSINQHLPDGRIVTAEGDFHGRKDYEGHPPVRLNSELMPVTPVPAPTLKEPPPFWWEFDRIEQLDLFAAVHPTWYWLAYTPATGGRLRALNLSETNLQKVAAAFREDPDVAASILKLYESGKAWPDLDPLYSLFFDSAIQAKQGAPGDAPECIVFTHGNSSFGRKALTHNEALNEWQTLEMIDTSVGAGAVAAQEIDGRGTFYELIAVGLSGAAWEIDREYFELRDVFLANVQNKAAGTGQSWHDLFHENLAVWEHYLRRALDRDEIAIDHELAGVIDTDSDFVEEAGARIYEQVTNFAYGTALSAVETAQDGLAVYLDNDKLQGLVLQFPFMSDQERWDALTYLGVPVMLQILYAVVLADLEKAQMIAMGEEVAGLSLAGLQALVQARFNELQKVVDAIVSGQVEPLSMEGDFGNEIRRLTYEAYGFKLRPNGFPHEDEAAMRSDAGGGRFGPNYSPYGSEAGYLFAQESARRARHARHMKYLLIAAVVVASVVLIIVAAEIGAVVAGLLFSATATTASAIGFVVTEVVVSAAIVTAVGPALNTFILSGGAATAADYKKAYSGIGWQFLINLGTFGFFKALGYGVRAAAVLGAGGKEAFAVSRGWQAADVAMRITSSGIAMFGISLTSYYLEHGKLPEGESMNEIIFETGLSIVLLEAGSFLARPAMENLQKWAEAKRLGDFGPRMSKLRLDVRKLNMDTAAFGANPTGGARAGTDLLVRQEAILTEQRKLLQEMGGSYRTGPDAEALQKVLAGEVAAIDARLAALRGVEAFAKAEVRPLAATGEDVAEFTYKRGHEKELEDYYGKDNVKAVGDHLEVSFEGKKLIFRPATDVEAGILPDGTRNPDALKAWRSTALSRLRKVIERAGTLGADDKALRDVAKADPTTMDADAMRAFEKQLDKAEKLLDKLETAAGPIAAVSIDRAGAATEDWRLRLVAERDRLLRRAKLLGLEGDPALKEMSRLPMSRTGLKENTLANYRDAIEKARQVVDKAQADRVKALDLAAGGPPADVTALRTKLQARRDEIQRRARIYGAGDRAYVSAVEKLRIGSSKSYETLSDAERTIELAEEKLDALAAKSLAKGTAAYGADVLATVRALPGLEKMTDAQVGDVLRMLASAGKLSEDALRGALLASVAPEAATRSPVPLDKVARLARSHDELEFVLETYAKLLDAQISGSHDLLRDAASSSGKWKGSVWQMELARYVIGLEKIAAFEVSVTTASGGRDFDIVLRDGTVIEAKDWSDWKPEKVSEQFYKDLEHNTRDGTQPQGIEKIKWLFRSPPPASLAKIRATMRATLETFIADKGLSKVEADALRDAFDAHPTLADVPKIDRTQVVKTPSARVPGLPPSLPQRKDDEP